MKLNKKNIAYNTCTDIDEMTAQGIKSAPTLKLEDNTILNFADAIKWVNEK
jgi:methionine aminopeptidase